MNRLSLTILVSLLPCLVSSAAAQDSIKPVNQTFLNPFIGTTLTSPSPNGGHSKAGFGLALGKTGKMSGLEAEIAYYPEVLDNAADALAKSHVLTFSSNLLVGPTRGRLRIYGAVGAGDLHLNVGKLADLVTPDPEGISSDYFAINVGGGVMRFFNSHLGVRGDLRYYRAFGIDLHDLDNGLSSLSHFNFWRANVGLIVK